MNARTQKLLALLQQGQQEPGREFSDTVEGAAACYACSEWLNDLACEHMVTDLDSPREVSAHE